MLKRKSIVLSDTQNQTNQKAVLTMQEDEGGISGSVRLYNFSTELSGVSSLGFYVNQKIYKAGLTRKANMFYEFFLDLNEIPQKFSCAVVNFQNAVATPVLYGASDGKDDDIYSSIIAQMTEDNSMRNAQNLLDKHGIDFADEEKEIIEKEIDEAMCQSCDNCANCVYKKYFYEHSHEKEEVVAVSDVISNKENKPKAEEEKVIDGEKDMQENQEPIFFEKLKPQIDKLFEKNPIEDNLQNLIPNSKWAKIEYEDDGDFYVFGLLYDEDDDVRYVCYGVPAVFEEDPPKELSGFPIWLPLNKENDKGFGYWLTYQDATTGEPVRAILD